MPEDRVDICESCGGSGVSFHQLGPFYTSVQRKWRDTVAAHIAARHEVFRAVDRAIAGQLIKVLKSDLTSEDILTEAHASLEKAMTSWSEGKPNDAISLLMGSLTRILYLLECAEVSKSKPPSG